MQYIACDTEFILYSSGSNENKNLALCSAGTIKRVEQEELNLNKLSGEDYYQLVWECIGLAVIVFGCLVVKKALYI